MKKRSYYRLWTELLAKHPELSQNENYFDMIENGYEVVIGDLTFGKNEMRNAYDQYYVETKEPYGFDETRFNVYDDLIPDEIRDYIPNMVIRAIRNAKSDFKKINGEYMVEFEYLPLQHKSVNDDRVFSAIKTLEFKIGDWLIIGDDKDIYRSTITDELTRKYNADFKSFVIIGEILTNNWHYKVVEEYRNKRDTDRMIRAILSAIRDHFYDKLTAPIPEKEPQYTADEMSDVIELATEFLSLPITTHFRSSLDIWRNGEAFFESKAETKDFIQLVNSQNIRRSLAKSLVKNPLSKFKCGGQTK